MIDEVGFTVRTAILEHRIPCLGFALKEKYHVNICKDRLEQMNYAPGSWLNELKQCIYDGKPDDHFLENTATAHAVWGDGCLRMG